MSRSNQRISLPKLALKRNPRTGWALGVCSGLAEYFGWSTGLVRLVFFVSLLMTSGTTLLVYLVMAVLMPKRDPWRDHRDDAPTYRSYETRTRRAQF